MSAPPPPARAPAPRAASREAVRPRPPESPRGPEPYRVLFPLGAAIGIAGVLPWLLALVDLGPWPGMTHAALMLEGFELCFVTGFLLTAMPAFTHGARCRPWELAATAGLIALFAALRLLGAEAYAHAAFALALAFTLAALGRRVRFGAAAPPEEFALVGLGLALGVAGGVWQALEALGVTGEPAPRFALRLVERGMVLALVLGLGGLLVPVFAGLRDPLAIVGVARAGQRGPRRAFVLALAALLAGALLAEALGHDRLGAWLRAGAALASTQLAWKLWRAPNGGRLAWCLWAAGWCVLLGLVAAALVPSREIAAWHLVLIGGYGLLTAAIATRVVVSHGGRPAAHERVVLGAGTVAGLGAAAALRLAADGDAPAARALYAAGAVAWTVAWALWLAQAWPRVRRTGPAPAIVAPPSR